MKHSLISLAVLLSLLSAILLVTSYAKQPMLRSYTASARLVSAGEARDSGTNFLICGKDRASGLLDVIMLCHFDPQNGQIALLQIPRDTYAEYTENSYKKLNGAAAALGGMDAFRDFLSLHLSLPIHHYLLLDANTLCDVVDAVGGVTVDVPMDMSYTDSAQGLRIDLKQGKQTLYGREAEQFVRFRAGYTNADLGRLDAQKQFLRALFTAVKEKNSLPMLVRVGAVLYRSVETDLSFGDSVRYAANAVRLSPDAIQAETLPGDAARTGINSGAWYYVLKRQATIDTLNRLFHDSPLSAVDFDAERRFAGDPYPHFVSIYDTASAVS